MTVKQSMPIAPRPADATHDALRKLMRWLDACRELGWKEDAMPALEGLFWRYHDSNGEKRKPSMKEAL